MLEALLELKRVSPKLDAGSLICLRMAHFCTLGTGILKISCYSVLSSEPRRMAMNMVQYIDGRVLGFNGKVGNEFGPAPGAFVCQCNCTGGVEEY